MASNRATLNYLSSGNRLLLTGEGKGRKMPRLCGATTHLFFHFLSGEVKFGLIAHEDYLFVGEDTSVKWHCRITQFSELWKK